MCDKSEPPKAWDGGANLLLDKYSTGRLTCPASSWSKKPQTIRMPLKPSSNPFSPSKINDVLSAMHFPSV